MIQISIAISLRVLYCYSSLNIVEENRKKKKFRQNINFIMLHLVSFLESNIIVHEYVSRGAEPESEL